MGEILVEEYHHIVSLSIKTYQLLKCITETQWRI